MNDILILVARAFPLTLLAQVDYLLEQTEVFLKEKSSTPQDWLGCFIVCCSDVI